MRDRCDRAAVVDRAAAGAARIEVDRVEDLATHRAVVLDGGCLYSPKVMVGGGAGDFSIVDDVVDTACGRDPDRVTVNTTAVEEVGRVARLDIDAPLVMFDPALTVMVAVPE